MSEDELSNVTEVLRSFREQSSVPCGRLQSKLGLDEAWQSSFNLGVAIAEDWPATEADPKTLQKFGSVLMARWGLMPVYNGVDAINGVDDDYTRPEFTASCPNAAMLILLPRYREAYVSAPSCEFICDDRGGPEVVSAMLEALDQGGVAAAIEAGVREAARVLAKSSPASLEPTEAELARTRAAEHKAKDAAFWQSERTWVLLQRCVILLIVGLVACGLANFVTQSVAPAPQEKTLRRGE